MNKFEHGFGTQLGAVLLWLPSCNSMCFGMAWQRPVERKEGGRRPRPVSPRRATPRSVAGNHPLRMSMNEKDV